MSAPHKRLGRLAAGLTRHLQVKLVLLLLAALCWVLVHTHQEMDVEFNLPLDLMLDLPPGRTLVGEPPRHVQVLMRGRGRNLLVFALFGHGVCRVDGGRGGESVPLTSKQLELDGAVDLSVISIFPALLPLDVDRLQSRRLPVRLHGVLEAAEGLVLGEPEFNPARVKVTGPRAVLDTLTFVETEELDLPHRKRDVLETVDLRLPWPSVALEPSSVTLLVRLDKRAERRFTGIPLQVRNLPAPLVVKPRSLSLTVVGGAEALATLEKSSIDAIFDYSRLGPDQNQAPCRIVLPPGLSWTAPDPALFRIIGRRAAPPRERPADSLDQARDLPPAP